MSDAYAQPGKGGGEPPTLDEPRCEGCRKLLARRVSRPWRIECSRCGRANGRPRPLDADGASAERR